MKSYTLSNWDGKDPDAGRVTRPSSSQHTSTANTRTASSSSMAPRPGLNSGTSSKIATSSGLDSLFDGEPDTYGSPLQKRTSVSQRSQGPSSKLPVSRMTTSKPRPVLVTANVNEKASQDIRSSRILDSSFGEEAEVSKLLTDMPKRPKHAVPLSRTMNSKPTPVVVIPIARNIKKKSPEAPTSPADSLFDGEFSSDSVTPIDEGAGTQGPLFTPPPLESPLTPIDHISVYSADGEGESVSEDSDIVVLASAPPGFEPRANRDLRTTASPKRSMRLVFSHVQAPPLPKGLRKKDYRPMESIFGRPSKGESKSSKEAAAPMRGKPAGTKAAHHNSLAEALASALAANARDDHDLTPPVSKKLKRKTPAHSTIPSVPSKKRRVEIEEETQSRPLHTKSRPSDTLTSTIPSSSSRISTKDRTTTMPSMPPRSNSEMVDIVAAAFTSPWNPETLVSSTIAPPSPPPPPSRSRVRPSKVDLGRIPLLLEQDEAETPFYVLTLLMSTRHVQSEHWGAEQAAQVALAGCQENDTGRRSLLPPRKQEDDDENEISVHHWRSDSRQSKLEDVTQIIGTEAGDISDADDNEDSSRMPPPLINLQEKLNEKLQERKRRKASRKSMNASQSVRGDTASVAASSQRGDSPDFAPMIEDDRPSQTPQPSAKALGKRRAIETPQRPTSSPARPSISPTVTRSSIVTPSRSRPTPDLPNGEILPSSSFATSISSQNEAGPYRHPGSSEVTFASIVSPSAFLNDSPSQPLRSMSSTDLSLTLINTEPAASSAYDQFEAESSIFSASLLSSWPTEENHEEAQFATVNPSLLEPSLFTHSGDPGSAADEPNGIDPAILTANNSPAMESGNHRLHSTRPSDAHGSTSRSARPSRSSSPEVPLKKSMKKSSDKQKKSAPPSKSTSPYMSPIVIPSDLEDGSWHSGGSAVIPGIAARKIKRNVKLPTKLTDIALEYSAQPKPKAKAVQKRSAVVSIPVSVVAGASSRIRPASRKTQDWATGPDATFCHQCRGKSFKLKMKCETCDKVYCNRCIHFRYADLTFAEFFDGSCPACEGDCNCDLCCRKRGDTFISSKPPGATNKTRRAKDSPRPERQTKPTGAPVSKSTLYRPTTRPPGLAEPNHVISNPSDVTFFAAVYDMDGQRVGTSFADLGDDEVSYVYVQGHQRQPQPAQGSARRRVFVGAVQESWNLAPHCKVTHLGGGGGDPEELMEEANARGVSRRVYVGKKAALFWRPPVVDHDRERLGPIFDVASPASSPLSSLSSLPSDDGDSSTGGHRAASSGDTGVVDTTVGDSGEIKGATVQDCPPKPDLSDQSPEDVLRLIDAVLKSTGRTVLVVNDEGIEHEIGLSSHLSRDPSPVPTPIIDPESTAGVGTYQSEPPIPDDPMDILDSEPFPAQPPLSVEPSTLGIVDE
ncbi:hypothetical protein BKA70DRAFT_1576695 [Coprinopsis sp. MPI-PUGE-AT-0042]|nr:hypothetical protein BKA70DRAFT_1576695 [Coprinopsis sp. MPI-PUGE-AT-0042]